jgi:hypothetical protein
MPTISRLAFVHDVAIDVAAVEVVDLTSRSFCIAMKQSGTVQKFSDVCGHTSFGHETLLASYRHAISSTEPAFQAISFFRVIEACYHLRGDRIRSAIASDQQPNEPGERFPDAFNEILARGYEATQETAFAPFYGMKFRRAHAILTERLRNFIAHLDIDNEIVHLDDFDDTSRVQSAVPVLHYMARELLHAELDNLVGHTSEEPSDS